MIAFDYSREAELFPARVVRSRGKSFSYRRFESAADAIQFAMEVVPAQYLAGAYLEVDEKRFDAEGIRVLYESPEYPLTRSRADPARTASTRAKPPVI